ncbi:uncharacterized protein LOC126678000 isoform X2 [Mercurialis annua]|uniref:uncharacterized protein LOC126678000 isoform X2 n=1 Tax=Mercurialis annua TaxID=3986 RepID=UPI002160C18D|nr:uncharacterized protein LOC126678000 isoform X2 [Mercurialis annua]
MQKMQEWSYNPAPLSRINLLEMLKKMIRVLKLKEARQKRSLVLKEKKENKKINHGHLVDTSALCLGNLDTLLTTGQNNVTNICSTRQKYPSTSKTSTLDKPWNFGRPTCTCTFCGAVL